MASATPSDLTQVAALFEACIEQIRSKPVEDLDKIAEEWLKDARVQVMKRIEHHFLQLSINASDPSLTPTWAIDPSVPLEVFSPRPSCCLESYIPLFEKEFSNLMKQCGFTATVQSNIWQRKDVGYYIDIYFPAGVALQRSTSHFIKSFDSLPGFSAAVLKITEGVVEPIFPPDGPSTLAERTSSPYTKQQKTGNVARQSTPRPTRKSGRIQSTKIAMGASCEDGSSSIRRMSKRLRNLAVLDAPGQNSDRVDGPRSKRLRGL